MRLHTLYSNARAHSSFIVELCVLLLSAYLMEQVRGCSSAERTLFFQEEISVGERHDVVTWPFTRPFCFRRVVAHVTAAERLHSQGAGLNTQCTCMTVAGVCAVSVRVSRITPGVLRIVSRFRTKFVMDLGMRQPV